MTTSLIRPAAEGMPITTSGLRLCAAAIAVAALLLGSCSQPASSTSAAGGPPTDAGGPSARPSIIAFAVDPVAVWALTETGLFTSSHAGDSWRRVQVPRRAALQSIVAYGASAVSLTGTDGSSIFVETSADAGRSWHETVIESRGQPGSVTVTQHDGTLAVLVRQTTSSNFSEGMLYVSVRGEPFRERNIPSAGRLSVTGPSQLWLAGGVLQDQLWRSDDAGGSWSRVPIVVYGASRTISPPERIGSQLMLAVTVNGTESRVAWHSSNDDGRTWKQVAIETVGGDTGPGVALPSTVAGGRIVVADPRGRFYFVAPDGPAARRVSPNGLPPSITSLGFMNATAGWAATEEHGCTSGKSECFIQSRLFRTSDGGQTWIEAALP
jgi:photosystem II stability/assembly factor-like uncharacterized protein